MKTDKMKMEYGKLMPVWRYNLHFSCGCIVRDVECAALTSIPDDVSFPHKCSKCNPPVGFSNVWD